MMPKPAGINPTHVRLPAPRSSPPVDPVADLKASILSANRLGQHAIWWKYAMGVKLKLLDYLVGAHWPRQDHAFAIEDAAAFLLKAPQRRVWIIGHAEASEGKSAPGRERLAEHRAKHVWETLARRKVSKLQVLALNGHGIMGAGSLESDAAKTDGAAGYEPGKFRIVEILLLNMNIQKAIDDHHADMRRRGFTI